MRKAADLIHRQEPIKINEKLLKQVSPDQVHVVVSLAKQRAYLLLAEEVVMIARYRRANTVNTSPSGSFSVLEKIPIIIPQFMAILSIIPGVSSALV